MKISPGVYFQPFDEKVYVHNVDTQKDYILGGIAFDVLEFFSKNENATPENLFSKLLTEYDIDVAELQKDIYQFISEMAEEKILYDEENYTAGSQWSNKIPLEIAKNFAYEHKLFSISLELTWRCVEKCIHCYIDDNDTAKFCSANELTFDDYKRILKQARELGCINLLLTGGEVLLRKDFCDITEYATSLGFIVNIFTTGLGLTDKIFDRLCAAKVNGISVSLYSGIAEEHDKITGVKGSFEKTLKAALMFKAAGINTFIKCVAMKQNLESLESLYELGKRLKIYVTVSPRIVSGHDKKCSADYSLGNLELYKKFYALNSCYISSDKTAKKFSREEMLNGMACYAGLSSCSIDPFGDVHPCITFSQSSGSVRENDLKNIWEQMRKSDFKNRLMKNITPQCEQCKYIENCTVCVADLMKKNHGNFDNCGETFLKAEALSEIMK